MSDVTRYKWIDCIKGVAIIMVVICHIMPDIPIRNWIYSFHLPIFFMVAGLLLANKDDWKNQKIKFIIIKKAKQLLWPYFTFSMVDAIFSILSMDFVELKKVCLSTISFDGYNTLWFLPALFIAEIIFVLLIKSGAKDWICIVSLIMVTFVFSSFYCGYTILGIKLSENLNEIIHKCYLFNVFNRAAVGCVFVFFGYKLLEMINTFKNKLYNLLIMVVSFIISVFLSQYNGWTDLHYSSIGNPMIYYVCAIFGCLFLITLMKNVIKKNVFLEYMGKNSLIVMATHLCPVYYSIKYLCKLDNLYALIVVLMVECIIIFSLNKYARWMITMPKRG